MTDLQALSRLIHYTATKLWLVLASLRTDHSLWWYTTQPDILGWKSPNWFMSIKQLLMEICESGPQFPHSVC